jgi:hypothetical protein
MTRNLTCVLAAAGAMLLLGAVPAAAQDPSWELIRPNVTWDNHWTVEPAPEPLFSVLDDPLYIEEAPLLGSDRASATRPRRRFSVGFEDLPPAAPGFVGGQLWLYIGIRTGTRVDIAARTRRDGRVVVVSRKPRLTPPVVLAPEDPPVGRNGFRGWYAITLPALTREEASRLSLAVRISPSSPTRSLSRVYAAFAELYPG